MTDAPTHPLDRPGGLRATADEPRYLAGERTYWYAWAPFMLLFAAVIVIVVPYLAVLVLLGIAGIALVALARFTWMLGAALYALGRAVVRRATHQPGPTAAVELRTAARSPDDPSPYP